MNVAAKSMRYPGWRTSHGVFWLRVWQRLTESGRRRLVEKASRNHLPVHEIMVRLACDALEGQPREGRALL